MAHDEAEGPDDTVGYDGPAGGWGSLRGISPFFGRNGIRPRSPGR